MRNDCFFPAPAGRPLGLLGLLAAPDASQALTAARALRAILPCTDGLRWPGYAGQFNDLNGDQKVSLIGTSSCPGFVHLE